MHWNAITFGAWLAAMLASGLWSRASEAEEAILRKNPPGTRLRLFLPWPQKSLLASTGATGLRGLRRRSLVSFSVAALLPLLLIAFVRSAPEGGASRLPERAVEQVLPPAAPGQKKAAEALGRSVPPGMATGEGGVGKTGAPETLEESRKPMRLYSTATVHVAYEKNYKDVKGVGIDDVKPGSFWKRIGARSGDLIVEFNGRLVNSPQASVDLMNELSKGSSLTLTVKGADGETRYLDFSAPK